MSTHQIYDQRVLLFELLNLRGVRDFHLRMCVNRVVPMQ